MELKRKRGPYFVGANDPALRISRGFTSSVKEALTPNEVAERLGVTTRTLRKWRARGEGPEFYKYLHVVRYPADKLEAFERNILLKKSLD